MAKMRASMARLTPRFSTNRVVREYTDTYYVPAASLSGARCADKGALGTELLRWARDLAQYWPDARFGTLRTATQDTRHQVSVEVFLGRLDADAVRVELYAEAANGKEPERHVMIRGRKLDGPGTGYEYTVSIPAVRAPADYTPRLVPYHPAAVVPLEAHEILWQRGCDTRSWRRGLASVWCTARPRTTLPFPSKPLAASSTGQRSEIPASSTLIRKS